jgi:DNA-binding transcriptional ArsR family regulator
MINALFSSSQEMTFVHRENSISPYNIFVGTNMISDPALSLARIFELLGQANRLHILLVIARQEACVCHLEAVLHVRQATISQHLMALRDAGLVVTHRDGRHIYYRLVNPELYDAICQIAEMNGINDVNLGQLSLRPASGCTCPHCHPESSL